MFAKSSQPYSAVASYGLDDLQPLNSSSPSYDRAAATKTEARPAHSRWKGWRVGVAGGAAIAAAVLWINIAVLIWAHARYGSRRNGDGSLRIYTPSQCSKTETVSTAIHFVINVASTLLLAASGYGIQCLSAPTRRQIDAAHAKGKWLHIGVMGYHNWLHVGTVSKVLWVILALSSVPLHLMYNSVFFTRYSSISYNAVYVAQNFVEGGAWNLTVNTGNRTYSSTESNGLVMYTIPSSDLTYYTYSNEPYWGLWEEYVGEISYLQRNQTNLVRLDNEACIKTFDQHVMSDYRSVLVVTDAINTTNSLLGIYLAKGWNRDEAREWICDAMSDQQACQKDVRAVAKDWAPTRLPGSPSQATVQYCLAEPHVSQCSINLMPSLLIAVIICNAAKVACLLCLMLSFKHAPLVTTGDAIASFLKQPDRFTLGWGPVEYRDIRKAKPRDRSNFARSGHARFVPRSHAWFRAASKTRWLTTLFLCSLVWVIPAFILFFASSSGLSDWRAAGWSSPVTDNIVYLKTYNALQSTMLANTPQLAVSVVYILYNSLFTTMVLSSESITYARKRNGLRVSAPEGQQRSSFWLQLPYRYSFPLMVTMAVLHWFISQGLFLVQVEQLDLWGGLDSTVNGTGWSGMPILSSLILGGVLIIYLMATGLKRTRGAMPVISSCSLAISAACHPHNEAPDIATKPVMYGVLSRSNDGVRRVGFSAEEVYPLDGAWRGAPFPAPGVGFPVQSSPAIFQAPTAYGYAPPSIPVQSPPGHGFGPAAMGSPPPRLPFFGMASSPQQSKPAVPSSFFNTLPPKGYSSLPEG